MFSLAPHTIFVTLAGSQAHGTAREGSDVDVRGVCVAPLASRLSLFGDFEQYDGLLEGGLADMVLPKLRAHPTASRGLGVKVECVVFDVAKFVRLCAAANPNALEILFADERDWVLDTASWRRLHERRRMFLTKKVQQTFLGYAMAQLKKIKTHRSWLLNPPAKKPAREDFGLPERSTLSRDDQNRIEIGIADKLRAYGVDDVEMPKSSRIAVNDRMQGFLEDALGGSEGEAEEQLRAVATRALSLPAEVAATLNAEKKYRAAMKHWESYQAWKGTRNQARAALEGEYGYDTKHAMHLIRLMRMGLEALEHGDLKVRRPDATELNSIRDGGWSHDELVERAESLRAQMQGAAKRTDLPDDVDRGAVDAFTVALMKEAR